MKPPLVNHCYYHIYNRGALKQPIFFEDADNLRFIRHLYFFNDSTCTPKNGHPMSLPDMQEVDKRKPLLSILAWCLMPNHYHLFVQQEQENGISRFQQKLGDGYTKYINTKYKKSGHLFEGSYQIKIIDNDAYFMHIARYLHLNPMELNHSGTSLNKFLEKYQWSSYKDWIGKENYPMILNMAEVEQIRTIDHVAYKQFLNAWVSKRTSDVRFQLSKTLHPLYNLDK